LQSSFHACIGFCKVLFATTSLQGASWIHGVNGNPITTIANDNNIARTSKTNYDDGTTYL
jgi:hypothetical protein